MKKTEMQDYTTAKSTVECYKLRHKSGMYWADVTIDHQERSGRIQIASDFGSWQNYWGACGKSFKEFLASINVDYFADKVGAGNWFDLDKTIARLRSRIIEYTTDRTEQKRLLSELADLEESSSREEFVHKMWSSKKIMEMEDQCPDIETSIHPGFQGFWDNCWPVLLAEFKKEAEELENAIHQ